MRWKLGRVLAVIIDRRCTGGKGEGEIACLCCLFSKESRSVGTNTESLFMFFAATEMSRRIADGIVRAAQVRHMLGQGSEHGCPEASTGQSHQVDRDVEMGCALASSASICT